jgi:uroporphyrinogen decarboxylase
MCAMTNRQRVLAVLRYQPYDRLPIVHFGYWGETLQKWAREGHITEEEARGWGDGNPVDAVLNARLGFDFDYYSTFHPALNLYPAFESKVVRELPGGKRHVLNADGVIVLDDPDAAGIAPEIETLLKDRAAWKEHYQWRYQWKEERVTRAKVRVNDQMLPFDQGGLEFLKTAERDYPYGLYCGSLFGQIRNVLGVEGSAFLLVDDEPLFDEIIQTVGDLSYRAVEYTLASGAVFDFAHFWEDICFKNGPLISPAVFEEKVGPQYKRITDLVGRHGLDIVSLDCDGWIDALIPAWFANGVNTMFPIEVGTWNASIAPWREKFGRGLRGVGGMNKTVFARDRAAVDAEIERLKPLVALGGFIPCPDHRIAPDAKWDLVRYYCDRMRKTFG